MGRAFNRLKHGGKLSYCQARLVESKLPTLPTPRSLNKSINLMVYILKDKYCLAVRSQPHRCRGTRHALHQHRQHQHRPNTRKNKKPCSSYTPHHEVPNGHQRGSRLMVPVHCLPVCLPGQRQATLPILPQKDQCEMPPRLKVCNVAAFCHSATASFF